MERMQNDYSSLCHHFIYKTYVIESAIDMIDYPCSNSSLYLIINYFNIKIITIQ